jgi:hypothetical protein
LLVLGSLWYTRAQSDKEVAMAYSLTDSLKHERFQVVDVDRAEGRLRVKAIEDLCTDLSCQGAQVIDELGDACTLDRVFPGDIVTMSEKDGRVQEIAVVRRAWDEYSSPEW